MWTFKVRYKASTEEFITLFFVNGAERKAARYYTTERDDAKGTGQIECARMNALAAQAAQEAK